MTSTRGGSVLDPAGPDAADPARISLLVSPSAGHAMAHLMAPGSLQPCVAASRGINVSVDGCTRRIDLMRAISAKTPQESCYGVGSM